eukprot:GHVR01159828.1.p1 GENE.GHVR01159828.1~~GHVR01159828.1.p1  ORF type:complete len:218 (-),score=-16.34 GHVR01159828.1:584-1237(-)
MLNVFNFNYINKLVCTPAGPRYSCIAYENIIGPIITFALFVIAFLISYIVINCCLRVDPEREDNVVHIRVDEQQSNNQNHIGFHSYLVRSFPSFVMIYFDYTIVSTTLAITKIIIVSYYAYLLAIPFLILLGFLLRYHFILINHHRQFSLSYRMQHTYFYLYDEFYHLYYLDYLYQQENKAKGSKKGSYDSFYPLSNILIPEVLYKFLLASSTVLLF